MIAALSSRRALLERACLDKSRLPDEATARAMAMHLLTLADCKARRAWVYRCEHCRGWHITTTFSSPLLGQASVSARDPWVPPSAEQARLAASGREGGRA